MGINFSTRLKSVFFDRAVVKNSLDKWTLDKLSSLGAFVRTSARSLLRKRKRVSRPGEPPSIHSQDDNATLRKVEFGYDAARGSVVIGPMPLNHKHLIGGQIQRGAVPRTLERGGRIGFREMLLRDGRWIKIGWRSKLADRLIPIWKASAQEKAAAIGRRLLPRKDGRKATMLVVPGNAKARVRYATIAARPFMGPAGSKGLSDWQRRFGARTRVT